MLIPSHTHLLFNAFRAILSAMVLFPALGYSQGLKSEGGVFYLNGKPYRGVGINYYDLFTRISAKPSNESTLVGLRQLAKAGIPFVRFNAGGFSERDWQRYLKDPKEFFASFDRVVRTAEEAGIGLIPSFFWNPILQKTVGERREAWGDPNSQTIALMRRYVADVVGRYKNSPAIWAWELGNEWNLIADLPNAASFRKEGEDERDDLHSQQMAVAIKEFAAAVRKLDARRALITGHSHPRAAAWHNTAERSWKPDSFEQWKEVILRANTDAMDTIGVHIYGDTEAPETGGKWSTDWADYLIKLRSVADEKKLPIFIGEFGLAEGGKRDREQVKERFHELLKAMEDARVDLAAAWVYDLSNQEGNWNITFNNDRAYMLDDVIAANKRWNDKPLPGK